MRGLAHQTPWRGIEATTLNELYDEAVAIVSRIAASQYRRDWRTHADLERAVIAAFRNQARHHWRHVNALKRRGDRDAVEFDPDLHADSDEVLTRIFDAGPHDELVARDWLAQVDGEVRAFWQLLIDGASFRQAGQQLGLTFAECKVLQRAGLEQFTRFRALQEAGNVCQLRASAIASYRDGTADATTAERAEAHLACCLACALVHDPQASAVSRGLFHLLPIPALARGVARLRDLLPERAAEATAGGATGVGGAMLLGNGATTALMCAGALAGGACVVGIAPIPFSSPPPHEQRAHREHARHVPAQRATPAALAVPPITSAPASTTGAAAPAAPRPRATTKPKARVSEFGEHRTQPKRDAGAMTQAQAREFDPEAQGSSAPASTSSTSSTASTAAAASQPSPTSSSTSTSSPSRSTSATASPSVTEEFGGP